jgi:hypothetical protein
MKQFRAIRNPYEKLWRVEEFDTEFQIASYWKEKFASKTEAEKAIKKFVEEPAFKDDGEKGEWIRGPI